MRTTVLLLCLIAMSVGQVTQKKAFTCSFSMTQPALSTRSTSGVIKYDWTARRYSLTFSGGNEMYTFNSVAGYGKQTGQFFFSYSSTCPCVDTPLANSMPAYAFNATLLAATSTANQYQPKAAGNQLKTVTFGAAGFPSASETVDGRKFTFTECVDSTFPASTWTTPPGCSCGSPQDVVIAWDRSSSISYKLFLEEKTFAQALVKGFTYGNLESNLGMVNFHTLTWPGPVMLNKGTSMAAALQGADDLACAPSAQCKAYGSTGTCCGAGTCISCGIVAGADMLATQASFAYERKGAAKVLIVFTDGGQSVLIQRNGEDPIRDASGQAQGKSGTINAATVEEDLKWAVAYAKRRVPDIQIYAVGAGPLFVRKQLQIITDGDDSKIFSSTAWEDILSLVGDLVAKTCSSNKSPCTSCCGSCTCSPFCRQSRALGINTCTDGNQFNGDGCDKVCRVEEGFNCPAGVSCASICGDSLIVGREGCDDGNKNSGDGCSSTCNVEAGWRCATPGKLSICGDGLKAGTEGCDDGNLVSNDGCSAKCVVEDGWACTTPGKPCTPVCGDGKLRGTESCDDGNKKAGDGCSATCGLEIGWNCPNPGKPCLDIDECALYGCNDPISVKYFSTCVDSTDTVTPRPAIKTRQCTCPVGFFLSGTDQTKQVRSVTLVSYVSFPGCRDLNECAIYSCIDPNDRTLATSCKDSTSSTSVSIQARTCTCTGAGWYAKQSNTKPPINWVSLGNNTAFTGCKTECGDGVLAGAEKCDDSNQQENDGCSPQCEIEPGFVCSNPGLACCVALEPALEKLNDVLRCWNGWWVPKEEAGGSIGPVTLGTPRPPKSEDDDDDDDDDDAESSGEQPFVINAPLKLCGDFVIAGTVIVNNANVFLAGTLELAAGGNLTFVTASPIQHGTVNLVDGCGLPQYAFDPDAIQFTMGKDSSLNINGFNWEIENPDNLAGTIYSQYINVEHCVDITNGDLYMTDASAIPDSSNSFPIIATKCDKTPPAVDGEEPAEPPTFANARPVDLPGGCSDITSYSRTNGQGSDIFVQTNKKQVCEAQVIPLSIFVPAIIVSAVGTAAVVALGLGVAKGYNPEDDYVAL